MIQQNSPTNNFSNQNSQKKWTPVTRSAPCQLCGKPDWCARTEDGATHRCMRPDLIANAGDIDIRQDDSGNRYAIYHDRSPASMSPPPPSGNGRSIERADPDTLDKVYRYMLDRLSLSKAHREALRKRGLDDRETDRYLFRTLGKNRKEVAQACVEKFGAETCRKVPGFYWKDKKRDGTSVKNPYWSLAGLGGLLIPSWDAERRIVAIKIRVDNPGEGGKYRSLSSSGHGGPSAIANLFVPPDHPENPNKIMITEGELKCLIATKYCDGSYFVGVPGVGNDRCAIEYIKQHRPPMVGIAFDNDMLEKPQVAQATKCLIGGLGANLPDQPVEVYTWADEPEKGIDDLLIAGKGENIKVIGDQTLEMTRFLETLKKIEPKEKINAPADLEPAEKKKKPSQADLLTEIIKECQLISDK